jgi:hypothetical protein
MRPRGVLLLAFLLPLLACGPADPPGDLYVQVEGGNQPMCAKRTGPYDVRYQVRSGNCVAAPERSILAVEDQPTALYGTCVGTVYYSANNCVQSYSHTCPFGKTDEPAKVTITGRASWTEDASGGIATEEWTIIGNNGRGVCTGRFDVTLTKSR